MSKIIDIHGFGYAYPPIIADQDLVWILEDIDLEVQGGEFVSVIGPTGVGKTTLCLALNGIVPQSTGGVIRGNVIIDGLNTKEQSVPELAQHVGLVFQDPETQLFNLTVEAELAFGLETRGLPRPEIEERISWALSLVGMSEHRQRSPFQLSGGQKQRVAIASVLAITPRVLVLDEPTASLDPVGKAEVFSVVRKLRRDRGMTIIMVEQELEHIAEFSDRVVVLNQGRVEMEGPPEAVFAQVDRLREVGVGVPQVSELAHCLNKRYGTDFHFVLIEQAHKGLMDHLDAGV